MPRKKKDAEPTVQNTAVVEAVHNGLSDAIGFGQGPFGGFPGANNQISNPTTIFCNLRWYLVSNFRQLLSEAYTEIGLIQTVVDVPVDDALRGGVQLKSKQLDEDQLKELKNSLDRDNDIEVAGQAAKWNRLFGGAGILILTDQDPELPLEVDKITKDDELEFRAVDMWELFWDKQNTDGYDAALGQEDFEYYNYYSEQVHKSRVMRLKGIVAPSFLRPRLRGWGTSVVEVLVRSINQYLKATDLGFEVLDEFKLDVYKLKNLVNTLQSPNGQQKVQQRVALANWQKNYQNAVVMDSEDEFDHKQLSFAGLAEAMAGIRMQVAADMRMPITKLFGTSVSNGFSTDQNDMENYNSMVESQVRNKLKYDILRICEIKCQRLFGFIPDDLELFFKPLRELTATDEETVKTQKFTRAIQAKAAGEITTQEFRDICNKGNLFDIELDTSGDGLDLDDPELEDVAGEGDEASDTEPGANKFDSRSPKLKTKNTATTPLPVVTDPSLAHDKLEEIVQEMLNPASDSKLGKGSHTVFDRAAYESDGGDDRFAKIPQPGNVEEALWAESKASSLKYYGKFNWAYVAWHYRKTGGVFTNSSDGSSFDREAYESDGGDERHTLIENPGEVDPDLWKRAIEASKEEYQGRTNWAFVAWRYRKEGGTFLT